MVLKPAVPPMKTKMPKSLQIEPPLFMAISLEYADEGAVVVAKAIANNTERFFFAKTRTEMIQRYFAPSEVRLSDGRSPIQIGRWRLHALSSPVDTKYWEYLAIFREVPLAERPNARRSS